MFGTTRFVVLEDKSRVIYFLFKLSMASRFIISPELPLFCLLCNDSPEPRQLNLRFDQGLKIHSFIFDDSFLASCISINC